MLDVCVHYSQEVQTLENTKNRIGHRRTIFVGYAPGIKLHPHLCGGGRRPSSIMVEGEAANISKTHGNVYPICVDLYILRI